MKKQKVKIQNSSQKDIPFFPEWLVWVIASVWGYIVLKNYFSLFAPGFNNLEYMLSFDQYLGIFNLSNGLVFKHIFNLLLALIFLFSAFSAGRVCLRKFFKWASPLEEIVFAVGLGLGLIAYIIFLLGISGLLYFLPIVAIILFFTVFGFLDFKKNPVKFVIKKGKLSLLDIFVAGILLVAMLINLAGALSPEIFYDSLVYHLAVPNYYKLHNKMLNMPYVFYSNLPLVHGMLYTAGLVIKDETLPKLINYSAGVISCLVLFSIAIKYFNFRIGLWASLIFYTITHVMISAWSCGTEMMLTFFGMLSFYSIANYNKERNKNGEKNWLVLSAIFAGLAMGVKYTGLFVALGVFAIYVFSEKKLIVFNPLKIAKNIFVWGLISSVIVMPWLVKNYIYKKNPVYPFMNEVFPKDPHSDYGKLKHFTNETRQFEKIEIKNWVKHPWLITMGKVPNSENFTPLFLFLIPLFLFFPRPPVVLKYAIVYFVVVWLTWSFSSTMIRFMMPAFPVAGLIISSYLNVDFYKSLKKILCWVVLVVCLINVYWSARIYYIQGGWKVVFGKQTKQEFLSTTHSSYPYGYYAAIEFINKNLLKDAKVMFIGEGRSFYIERIPVVSTAQDTTPIVKWAKSSKSADELYLKIKQECITHIFFNLGEAIRLGKSYRMFQWDEKSLSVYNKFWKKYVKEIFYKDETIQGNFLNRVAVYEILKDTGAAVPHIAPINLMSEIVVKNIRLVK
ncbi:MAG: phospholipid carrier-dependent glycosyltransferase [Elusimicrobiota bacterium]